MKTISAGRRSKFGFGYTAGCIQTENGLKVAEVDKPDYTGTVRQVLKMIKEARTLRSFQNGTYHRTQWFVKAGGKWMKINSTYGYQDPVDLLVYDNDYQMYLYDKIELTVF